MKYVIIFLALPLLCSCTKKAVKQLEYDMLVATDHQCHIQLEEMEQDKNLIVNKKGTPNDKQPVKKVYGSYPTPPLARM